MLVAIMLTGCSDTYIIYGLDVDPYRLTEYNTILHDSIQRPLCGSTVIESTDTRTRVITAAHCVDSGSTFYIQPNNEELYEVEVIAFNYNDTDLAVLQTIDNPIPVQPAALVAMNEPELGADIWTLGCGAGEPDALSKGIVSKIYVEGHYGRLMNQFDITVWYGNSGGGIFDYQGTLVGVVSQFGPQFERGWFGGEPETGWMYGVPVSKMREMTGGL
jgi:hypothetical protein